MKKIDFSKNRICLSLPEVKLLLLRVKRTGERLDSVSKEYFYVREARRSYKIWGNVRFIDRDDEKSFIYLVRADYKSPEGRKVSEWITLRMIAANNQWGDDIEHMAFYPNGNGRAIPLAEKLQEQGIKPHHLGAISRIAKIPPPHQTKAQYFAQIFTLLRLMVAADAEKLGIKNITMRYQPILDKLGAIGKKIPRFSTAEQTLSLVKKGKIRIHREDKKAWEYALNFPAYFLKVKHIRQILQRKLGKDYSYKRIPLNRLDRRNAKKFVSLLLGRKSRVIKGKNGPVKLKDLHQQIYEKAQDAIILTMMPVSKWKKMSLNMLETFYSS